MLCAVVAVDVIKTAHGAGGVRPALIGLCGVLVGILLSEYFRRRARSEAYSQALFEKRFAVYEALWKEINRLNDLAASLVNDKSRPAQERQQAWERATLEFYDFIADNALYISREVIAGTAFIHVVDGMLKSPDSGVQEADARDYHDGLFNVREMIRAESGAHAATSLLNKIFNVRHRSKYVDVLKKRKPGIGGF